MTYWWSNWLSVTKLEPVAALECTGLGIGYPVRAARSSAAGTLGASELHRQLNLRFESGLVHGVLGENGSGKSCLIKTLAGLVRPLSGQIELQCGGAGATRLQLAKDARVIMPLAKRSGWQGYLQQQAQVYWNLTVRDVVALGASARRDWSREQRVEAVEAALIKCKCADLALRPVLQLSAGERQRVMLARVLAAQPQVLLVDEPTAGLDPRHQHGIMQLLREQARAGVIVIAVMHDIELTRRYCDTALLLERFPAGCKDRPRCSILASEAESGCKNRAPGAGFAPRPVAEVLTDAAVRRVFGIG